MQQVKAIAGTAPAVRTGKAFRLDLRAYLLPGVLAVILLLLCVMPVMTVIIGSFRPSGLPISEGWTLNHYAAIWSSSYTYELLLNTVLFATGATTLSITLGGVLAWLIERTDMPGRRAFQIGILMPMATPPLLLAIGWALLLSPTIGFIPNALSYLIGDAARSMNIFSFAGMMFVQGLVAVPTSFLILAPIMRNMDPSYEEAAFMSGASFWRTLRRVSLPFLVPPVLSLVTLLMTAGMLTFDVPAVIGLPGNIHVMSSEIYNLMHPTSGVPAYGRSAALNSSLFLVLGSALALYYYIAGQSEKYTTIRGKAYKATRFTLGRFRYAAMAVVVVYFALAVVLPFLALLWVALAPYFAGFQWKLVPQLSPAQLLSVMAEDRVWRGTLNTVVIALTSSSVATVLALLVAWTVIRSKVPWARFLDVLAMVPKGVPHLMLGVALVFIFFTVPIPLYGTVWIIALGHLIVYLPIAQRMMQAAVIQVHQELEEAACMSGASTFQNLRRVVIPLIRPMILGLFIWLVVHSVREFSVAVMLLSPANETLSVVLYGYWETGRPEAAASIAVMLMLSLGALVLASRMLLKEPEV